MNFKDFKKDVESAFNAMIADNLFVVKQRPFVDELSSLL